jgi:hypothetical protein
VRIGPALVLVVVAVGCSPTADRDPAGADGAPDDDRDGAPTDRDGAPLPPPAWSSDMTTASASEFYTRLQPGASVDLGVADPAASDGVVARLRFPGLPALGTADRVGPGYASELATNRDDFHHGIYRMRVRLAACPPGEEVVNGLFTYFNDGTDHDGDGLTDNSEIDIEVLCGTPAVVFLSVWTEYTFATEEFRKWTRAIDLTTGDLWDSPSDHEHGLVRAGRDPALALPTLLAPDAFVELGFEWRADRVRFFAVSGGRDVTLAELTDPARVPTLPGALMFNVWHPGEHWFGGGGPPDYPADDATLLVDWARYWR